ncbi:MAG: GAF domain-containing protein [Sphingorhabdus sp.]
MCASVSRLPVEQTGGPLRLSEIADALGVPVVILAYEKRNGGGRFATYGLELDIDRSRIANAFGAQCGRGATVIPNIAVHPELSQWADPLVKRGIRFMVGVPLFNDEGLRTGSISVVAEQKHVAGHGIQVHLLKELGAAFLAQAG